MILSFEITMPNVGSWNGVWTGAKDLHFTFRTVSKSTAMKLMHDQEERNFYYNFNDGWGANVEVKIMDRKTKKFIEKNNSGFMGYDWMIDSILQHDKIICD